jgi:ribosomal protein S18 acetylase RimI-like enzyme
MIRPTIPADVPRLIELSAATGLFRPEEIVALGEVLDDYFTTEILAGDAATHCCFTSEQNGQIIGYVYLAVAEMSEAAWHVWWIAVDPAIHKRGAGRALMHFAEDEARKRGGRVMFVETSGIPEYELTRTFYLKNGYEREAVLRDFYRDGDDMVIFRKRLKP